MNSQQLWLNSLCFVTMMLGSSYSYAGELNIETGPKASNKQMVLIPAATFQMGCVPNDSLCSIEEKPRHKVRLKAFRIDKTEVTVSAYSACVKNGINGKRCKKPKKSYNPKHLYDKYCNFGRQSHDNHPMNCISWHQAKEYCELHKKRLPTEAEWEYAARGNNNNIYPWGDQKPNAKRAIYRGSRNWKIGTAEVGSLKELKTAHDLHDMAGNVWEWVEDCYAKYSSKINRPTMNTPNNCSSGGRVFRGGSFRNGGNKRLRASNRNLNAPELEDWAIGFRCAVSERP